MKLSEIRSCTDTEFVQVDDDPPPYWEPRGIAEHLAEAGAREGRARGGGEERLRRMRSEPLRLRAWWCSRTHLTYIVADRGPGVRADDIAAFRVHAGRGAAIGSAWPAALRLLALRRDLATRDTDTTILWKNGSVTILTFNLPFAERGARTVPTSPRAARDHLRRLVRDAE